MFDTKLFFKVLIQRVFRYIGLNGHYLESHWTANFIRMISGKADAYF